MTDVFDELTTVVARKVVDELRGSTTWVHQRESPLGRNRHCAAVRRRLAEGLDDAAKVGNRHLLTEAALREEMRRCFMPGMRRTKAATASDVAPVSDERQAAYQAAGEALRRIRRGA